MAEDATNPNRQNCRTIQKFGNNWDHLWKSSNVKLNIIAIPTRLRLLAGIQLTRCGQKMVREKQLGNVPKRMYTIRGDVPRDRSYILQTKDGTNGK